MEMLTPYSVGAYLLVALGLAGTVLPLVPGPLLIWAGALVWAWGNGFEPTDWLLLVVLGLLAILAWGVDVFMTTVMSRKSGVSWKGIGASIVFGLIGGIVLSEAPIIGTIFGALIGSIVGMSVVEYLDKRNLRATLGAVRTYLISTVLSSVFEIILALVMVGIFAWRVLA